MWLIEKNPSNEDWFKPINTRNLLYIRPESDKDDSEDPYHYAITFKFNTTTSHHHSLFWVKWRFKTEKERDKYLMKIYEKLPKIELGINDITL